MYEYQPRGEAVYRTAYEAHWLTIGGLAPHIALPKAPIWEPDATWPAGPYLFAPVAVQ